MNDPRIVHPEAHVRGVAPRGAAVRVRLEEPDDEEHPGDGVSDEADAEKAVRGSLSIGRVLGGCRGGVSLSGPIDPHEEIPGERRGSD